MGLIREPIEVDFVVNSEPWTKEELEEFSALIKKIKAKNAKKKARKKKDQATKS